MRVLLLGASDKLAFQRLTSANSGQGIVRKWIFLPGLGLVFTITVTARENIEWISCWLSLIRRFQAM